MPRILSLGITEVNFLKYLSARTGIKHGPTFQGDRSTKPPIVKNPANVKFGKYFAKFQDKQL
jgi:hypothetical protein